MSELYQKFEVRRLHGEDKPGQEYFVLSPTHDVKARNALTFYAELCLKDPARWQLGAELVEALSRCDRGEPFLRVVEEENMEGTLEELQAMSQDQLIGVVTLLRRKVVGTDQFNVRLLTCLEAVRHPDVRSRAPEIIKELKHMDGEHWAVGELLERVCAVLDEEVEEPVDETEEKVARR